MAKFVGVNYLRGRVRGWQGVNPKRRCHRRPSVPQFDGGHGNGREEGLQAGAAKRSIGYGKLR